jgi:hypothetical protein
VYENLRTTKIKTYSEFWDETWDEISYDRLREKIEKIGETCLSITKRYTLKEIFDKTITIGNHNRMTHTNTIKIYNTDMHYTMMMNRKYFIHHD